MTGTEAAGLADLGSSHQSRQNWNRKTSDDGFSTSWIMSLVHPMEAVWWAARQEDRMLCRGSPPAPAQLEPRYQLKLVGISAAFLLTSAPQDLRGTERKAKKVWGLN